MCLQIIKTVDCIKQPFKPDFFFGFNLYSTFFRLKIKTCSKSARIRFLIISKFSKDMQLKIYDNQYESI